MNRRQFVRLGASTAGLVFVAGCGTMFGAAAKHARIGVLSGMAPSAPEWQAFVAGLREYGWIEDQNLALDWRVDVDPAALAQDAAELVRVPVDVIVTGGTAAYAAKTATATIPIVLANARVRERANARLYRKLARMPSAEQRDQLRELLVVPAGARRSPLDQLRRGPTQPTAAGWLRRCDDSVC